MIQQQKPFEKQFEFAIVKTENSAVSANEYGNSNEKYYQQSFGNNKKHTIQNSYERKQNQKETRIKLVSSFQSSYLQTQQSKGRQTFDQNSQKAVFNDSAKLKPQVIVNAQLTNSCYTGNHQIGNEFKNRKESAGDAQLMFKNVQEQVKEEQFLLNLERQVHKYLLQRLKTRQSHPSMLNSKTQAQVRSSAIEFLHCSQEYFDNIEKMKKTIKF